MAISTAVREMRAITSKQCAATRQRAWRLHLPTPGGIVPWLLLHVVSCWVEPQVGLSLLHAMRPPRFLCGQDPLTGQDYSHRRDWIINREEQLAQLFTIEVEFRAEMSNHLHAVLRTRPEIAKRLPPREVARRWLTITKLAKSMSDDMPEPDEKKIDKLVGNKTRIAELRRRLSSISWFMGILCENIARARIARMVPPAVFGRHDFAVENVPM